MTKEEYIRRSIKAGIRLGRYFRFYDAEFENDELVVYDGITYYPEKLILGFDREGMSVLSCRLHSLSSNSVLEVELSKVREKEIYNEQNKNND